MFFGIKHFLSLRGLGILPLHIAKCRRGNLFEENKIGLYYACRMWKIKNLRGDDFSLPNWTKVRER